MDLGVFYDVIVPLMEVEGTATICISTPLDEFNFYSALTDLKDEKGRHVFNVKHIRGNIPVPWKSNEGLLLLPLPSPSSLFSPLTLCRSLARAGAVLRRKQYKVPARDHGRDRQRRRQHGVSIRQTQAMVRETAACRSIRHRRPHNLHCRRSKRRRNWQRRSRLRHCNRIFYRRRRPRNCTSISGCAGGC